MAKARFPVGKVPLEVLERLLERNPIRDERILVGPGIGRDAAVIDIGGPRYLIAKTDPITFTAAKIGWYAVHINANDIAVMGGRPRWFLATLLLPEHKATKSEVDQIFTDIVESCERIGASLIGGHTEVTHGLDRPIVIGQMLGEVEKEKLVQTSGAREGDALVLTKGVAIEGTAVVAREKEEELEPVFGAETVLRMKNFIYDPGISVLGDALVATESAEVHAMHDPTEGGLATALHELARAADVGIVVDLETIRVFPETRMLCDHYGLDALGVIASGALLIAVDARDAQSLVESLNREGIAACKIGEVVGKSLGLKLRSRSGTRDLPLYEQDEVTKILGV